LCTSIVMLLLLGVPIIVACVLFVLAALFEEN
jgi:hypothetical protein